MASCHSWLRSCAFWCHLLLSSFDVIFCCHLLLSFADPSCVLPLSHCHTLSLSLSREKSDWKKGFAVSSSGSSAAATSKVT